MKLRLKKLGDEAYLHKQIMEERLFRNSFIENSVQYASMESTIGEDVVFLNGSAFSQIAIPSQKDFEVLVSSDCPILKLHFSLEGGYRYKSLQTDEYSIDIPENHCNMFYSPTLEGKDIFSDKNSRFFEIYVAPGYLQRLLCGEFQESRDKMNKAINNLEAGSLWEKSRPISALITSKINEIIQCPYEGHVRQNYLESELKTLLIDFLLGRQTSKALKADIKIPKADYLALVKVEAYIRKNLKKPLNILDLAEIAGFNATKLKRDFKKVYGVTIFKHITRLRMEEAKKMITAEGASVAQAAYEVGYANPQHFTAAFKRTMGYLPSQLKQTI